MTGSPARTPLKRRRTVAVFVIAIVAALVVWLLVKGGDDSSSPATASDSTLQVQGAAETSPDALRTMAQKQTIYWAGEMPDTKLELTVTASGNVFVRYLDKEASVGTKDQDFLDVATYPANQALTLLQNEAEKTNAETKQLSGGGLVMVDKSNPTSVYLAYPGTNYQVEVYDPSPKRALKLMLSGAIQPIEP